MASFALRAASSLIWGRRGCGGFLFHFIVEPLHNGHLGAEESGRCGVVAVSGGSTLSIRQGQGNLQIEPFFLVPRRYRYVSIGEEQGETTVFASQGQGSITEN